jgi:metal-responsive CopG/Arc/MetJ family transcriptional regulator
MKDNKVPLKSIKLNLSLEILERLDHYAKAHFHGSRSITVEQAIDEYLRKREVGED